MAVLTVLLAGCGRIGVEVIHDEAAEESGGAEAMAGSPCITCGDAQELSTNTGGAQGGAGRTAAGAGGAAHSVSGNAGTLPIASGGTPTGAGGADSGVVGGAAGAAARGAGGDAETGGVAGVAGVGTGGDMAAGGGAGLPTTAMGGTIAGGAGGVATVGTGGDAPTGGVAGAAIAGAGGETLTGGGAGTANAGGGGDDTPAGGTAGASGIAGATAAAGGNGGMERLLVDGLLGYWPLDEGPSATTHLDASGNGWDATNVGNPSSAPTTAPVVGSTRSVFLDGVQDALLVSGIPREALPGWSYSLWLRPTDNLDASSPRMGIVSGETGAGVQIAFNQDGDGRIAAYLPGTSVCATTTTFWPEAVWVHLAVTFDGNQVLLYVDGAEQCRIAHSTFENNLGMILGSNSASSDFFHGHLDEVRVYARALSPAEVAALTAGA